MLPEEQIEKRGIRDPRVIEAIRSVRREEFVPGDLRDRAYDDRPLDIGYGATISQPYIVAAMTELLELRPENRVLEIGTGSGYQAAVLSRLVAQVFSIEAVLELAQDATALLERLGYSNVRVRVGDGYAGWPEDAPFDRIILTAAPAELPATLVDQLACGGRLVAPVGEMGRQELIVVEKSADGTTTRSSVFEVNFVPMLPAGTR